MPLYYIIISIFFLHIFYLEFLPDVSLCTLDVICDTAMGQHIGAQENSSNPYVRNVRFIFLGCDNIVLYGSHFHQIFKTSFVLTVVYY